MSIFGIPAIDMLRKMLHIVAPKKTATKGTTVTVKPWPSALNPCINESHPRKAPNWGVRGRVTRLCVYCVLEREKENGGDRQAAIDTFNPDPKGNPTHA